MKRLVSMIAMLACPFIYSQDVTQDFEASNASLKDFLQTVEEKFDVSYSYVDSIISDRSVSIIAGRYSIDEVHAQISKQTTLAISKIDDRYFAVHIQEKPASSVVLDQVEVTQFLSQGIRKIDNSIVILPQRVRELPGITDADILFSLQQLPGVKSPNETASGLHIRGGTPDQNLILWNGIRIYHPGHLFGMISPFNSNLKQSVRYFNKGTDAKFGERVSGTIDIHTSEEVPNETSFSAGINGINADANVSFPIVDQKLGVEFAARKSLTEFVQTPTFNSLADKVFQNTSFRDFNSSNAFGFNDFSLKLISNVGDSNVISATGILVDNNLDFLIREQSGRTNYDMDILNFGYSFSWTKTYSPKFSHDLRAGYSEYDFNYFKTRSVESSLERFTKLNRIVDSAVELGFKFHFSEIFTLNFGYQLLGNDVSHSFTTATPGFEITLDQQNSYNVTNAAFAMANFKWHDWTVAAGLRYNTYSIAAMESLEPRLFVKRRINDEISFEATYEQKSQVMSQIRETVANDLSLENYVWVLSDDGQPIQRAQQISIGGNYRTKSWLVDVDGYFKTITGTSSLSFGFMHQFDSSLNHGEGFVKGFDILIQKTAPTWRAWFTYTFQESQNRYDDLNDHQYFPISADIRHSFTLSAHKTWKKFSLSAGWFWHTGRPFSSLDENNMIAGFNDKRLKPYHRLDISAFYEFRKDTSWSGKIGLSALNVYNEKSIISKEYQRSYATINDVVESTYTVQNYRMLGFTPNLFVRIEL